MKWMVSIYCAGCGKRIIGIVDTLEEAETFLCLLHDEAGQKDRTIHGQVEE